MSDGKYIRKLNHPVTLLTMAYDLLRTGLDSLGVAGVATSDDKERAVRNQRQRQRQRQRQVQ